MQLLAFSKLIFSRIVVFACLLSIFFFLLKGIPAGNGYRSDCCARWHKQRRARLVAWQRRRVPPDERGDWERSPHDNSSIAVLVTVHEGKRLSTYPEQSLQYENIILFQGRKFFRERRRTRGKHRRVDIQSLWKSREDTAQHQCVVPEEFWPPSGREEVI